MPIYGPQVTMLKREWLVRFIATLSDKCPDMGASEARRVASAIYARNQAIDPASAVAAYLVEHVEHLH